MNICPISETGKQKNSKSPKDFLVAVTTKPTSWTLVKSYSDQMQWNNPDKQKCAIFTYIGNKTRSTINYLNAQTYKNHTQNYQHYKPPTKTEKPTTGEYSSTRVHQLQCKTCQLKYVVQTGRPSKTWFKEQIQAVKCNQNNSLYA